MNNLQFDFNNYLPLPQVLVGGTYKLKVSKDDLDDHELSITDCSVAIEVNGGGDIIPLDGSRPGYLNITDDDSNIYIEPTSQVYSMFDGEYLLALVIFEPIQPLQLTNSVMNEIEPIIIPTTIINVIRGNEKQYAIRDEEDIEKIFTESTVDVKFDIIGTPWFEEVYGLRTVKVPEGVTNLESDVFYNTDNLYRVELPSTLKYVNSSCFSDCNNSIHELICHGEPFNCDFTDNNYNTQNSFSSDSILYVPCEYLSEYENNENYSFFSGRIKPLLTYSNH